MALTTRKLAGCLLLAFGLVACENAQDVAEKPGVADAMVTDSLQNCDTSAYASPEAFGAKLRQAFMDTYTQDLKTIKDAKLTVCLDPRMETQNGGFWDKDIVGMVHKKESIVSLNDKVARETPYHYSDTSLQRLADKIREGALSGQGDYVYAGRYSCGKGCTTTRWKQAADFDQDSIAKNPQLHVAPVRR